MKWDEPPARPTKYDWHRIAAQLRQRPMAWALIYQLDRRSVWVAIKQGSISAVHPDLGFETTTSNNQFDENGKRLCTLHMRFNPAMVDPLRSTLMKEN